MLKKMFSLWSSSSEILTQNLLGPEMYILIESLGDSHVQVTLKIFKYRLGTVVRICNLGYLGDKRIMVQGQPERKKQETLSGK
jgi:hypothetical protein